MEHLSVVISVMFVYGTPQCRYICDVCVWSTSVSLYLCCLRIEHLSVVISVMFVYGTPHVSVCVVGFSESMWILSPFYERCLELTG